MEGYFNCCSCDTWLQKIWKEGIDYDHGACFDNWFVGKYVIGLLDLKYFQTFFCPKGQLIRVHWSLLLWSNSIIRRQSHLNFWRYRSVPQASPRLCLSGLRWRCTLGLYDFVKTFTFPQKCLLRWYFWRLEMLLCSATEMSLLMGWGTTKSWW